MSTNETKKGKAPAHDATTEAGQEEGSKTEYFRYFGREAFKVIYDEAMSLRIHRGPSVYYIHGTLGFGETHVLAALAISLLRGGKKAVFLPDSRQFARYPLGYLKHALVLTYAGDLEAQSESLQLPPDWP